MSKKKLSNRPEWNDRFVETQDFKSSKADLLQKKINLVSKNRKAAKQEWRNKQEALMRGQVPQEYKEWLGPKQKKFTAMSTFCNDRALHDEYQNRFRKRQESAFTQPKRVNYKKMQREVEKKELKMQGALNNDFQKPQKGQKGRKRPITSTKPATIRDKRVIDYAQDSPKQEEEDVFRVYDKYDRKDYKFNSDLHGEDKHNDQEQLDEVIDIMNDNNPTYNPPEEKEQENKEHDYLDFQANLDNLKKIHQEQEKFDFANDDLDSCFGKLNSLLGSKPVEQRSEPEKVDFIASKAPEIVKPQTSGFQSDYSAYNFNLPPMPKLETQDYTKKPEYLQKEDENPTEEVPSLIPNYKGIYSYENSENQNPNLNPLQSLACTFAKNEASPDTFKLGQGLNDPQSLFKPYEHPEQPSWQGNMSNAQYSSELEVSPIDKNEKTSIIPESIGNKSQERTQGIAPNKLQWNNREQNSYVNNFIPADNDSDDEEEEEHREIPIHIVRHMAQYQAPSPNYPAAPQNPSSKTCFADLIQNTHNTNSSASNSIQTAQNPTFQKPQPTPVQSTFVAAPSNPPAPATDFSILNTSDSDLANIRALIQSTQNDIQNMNININLYE